MSTILPPKSLLGEMQKWLLYNRVDDQEKAACSRMYSLQHSKKTKEPFEIKKVPYIQLINTQTK